MKRKPFAVIRKRNCGAGRRPDWTRKTLRWAASLRAVTAKAELSDRLFGDGPGGPSSGSVVSRIPARTRYRPHARRGTTVVETALVLPLVLLFIFGIMEYARYLLCAQVVTNAAREGCRYAVTHTQPVTINGTTTGNATSDVTNQVTKFLVGQTLTGQQVNVYQSDSQGNNLGGWNGASPGQYVAVEINGSFQITVPALLSFPSSVPVDTKVVMICEGN